MSEIGAAIVGTGFMSWVHAEALRRIGIEVVGICGSSMEKSQSAAEKLRIARSYENFSQVLEDPDVQSVHIATPNRTHFDMAKRAIAAGKHVMCEKPLAMNSAESSELVRLAAANPHLATAVNYNVRFYPLCLEARELSRQGGIGDVVHVTGSYVQDWLTRATDFNWRVLSEENGELRAVADIGTHWLDLVHAITGLDVDSVCADLKTVHPVRQRPSQAIKTFQGESESQSATEPVEINTEDYGAMLLRFRGGVRGSLHVSQVSPGRKNCLRFEIAGSLKTLAWDSERPNELWIGHRDQANELVIRDPALLTGSARTAAEYPGGHNEGYADSFKQSFRVFYERIDRGDCSSPPMFATFADGHREIALCEAILQSHREERWVQVDDHSDSS